MKRLGILLLIVSLVLAFAGCNETPSGGNQTENGDKTDALVYADARDLILLSPNAFAKAYDKSITCTVNAQDEQSAFSGEVCRNGDDYSVVLDASFPSGDHEEEKMMYVGGVLYDPDEETRQSMLSENAFYRLERYLSRFVVFPICEDFSLYEGVAVTETKEGTLVFTIALGADQMEDSYELDVERASQTFTLSKEGYLLAVETTAVFHDESIAYNYSCKEAFRNVKETPKIYAPLDAEDYEWVGGSDIPDAPTDETPGSGNTDGGGDTMKLPFEGVTLKVEVSANRNDLTTFPAADIYTRGPDQAASNDIQRAVLSRNERVASELGLTVQYMTSDLYYSEVLGHVQKYVMGAAEDAPDIVNNDTYGLSRAMLSGYLWNVKNPGKDANGEDVVSYFDLDSDVWYRSFMEGLTLDTDKMYLLAGIADIDVLRNMQVLFVNVSMWNENAKAMGEYGTYEEFSQYTVDTGSFTFDDVKHIARMIWRDDGNVKGMVDIDDDRVGLAFNGTDLNKFFCASGLPVLARGENAPYIVPAEGDEANDLRAFSGAYCDLYNSGGILRLQGNALSSLEVFMNGTALFTVAGLGEMESELLRNTAFSRGILPIPQYKEGCAIASPVSDLAEVTCVLNNTHNFTAASAYLQLLNESSDEVYNEYYEVGLKFKYNDNGAARAVMDLVVDSMASPFESVLGTYVYYNSSAQQRVIDFMLSDAINNSNTFMSRYASVQPAYEYSLKELLERFDKIY